MTIPMPEPVAYLYEYEDGQKVLTSSLDAIQRSSKAWLPMITTTQAEAYADARVREALEEVNQVLEGLYTEALNARVPEDEDDEAWNITCLARAQSISQAQLKIRALIPQQ